MSHEVQTQAGDICVVRCDQALWHIHPFLEFKQVEFLFTLSISIPLILGGIRLVMGNPGRSRRGGMFKDSQSRIWH